MYVLTNKIVKKMYPQHYYNKTKFSFFMKMKVVHEKEGPSWKRRSFIKMNSLWIADKTGPNISENQCVSLYYYFTLDFNISSGL